MAVRNSYPLTKCYSPRIVQNKYTGELVEVGCGVCKACLLRKANKMSFLCSMEENDHKYCMFVNLSYAPEYAPLMYPVIDDEHNVIRWISECDRLGDRGNLMAVDNETNHRSKNLRGYLSLLRSKTDPKHDLNGRLTYVSKRDIQLFLKRLRKYLGKYTDEKIRYYAVSEYGPKTFRAHYHLLLFYDKVSTQKVMSKALRSSWQFGRIDFSLSRGKCTSYVSKYVNSNYFIPPFLGSLSTKPFSLHSRFFAQGVYRRQRSEIYSNEPDEFVRLGGELNGNYVEFMPWRSLACTFFPKCKGFGSKSDCDLWKSYNILREVRQVFGSSFETLSLPQIAQNLLDFVISYRFPRSCCDVRYTSSEKSVCEYFSSGMIHNPYVINHYSADDYKYFLNSILSELYVSKHFLTYVCDNESYRERRSKLNLIKRFWNRYDYALLVSMYESQQSNASSLTDFSWYYVNKIPTVCSDGRMYVDVSRLSKEKFYRDFVIESDSDFDNSIKHKRLNDANLIFINY